MTKTWFITGASSGLGRIMTEKLLDRGDRVIGTARRTVALSDLASAHANQLHVVSLDLIDTVAVRAAIDQAFERVGRIDVVVSNAGYGLFGAGEELSDEQIDRQLATISPARSNLSVPACRTSDLRAAAASSRFPPRAGRSHTRPSAFIMPASGASKVSSRLLPGGGAIRDQLHHCRAGAHWYKFWCGSRSCRAFRDLRRNTCR